MQIGNSGPAFGFLGMNKKQDDKKTKHAGHAHKGHAAHHKHKNPTFGAITGSGGVDSFSRTPKH